MAPKGVQKSISKVPDHGRPSSAAVPQALGRVVAKIQMQTIVDSAEGGMPSFVVKCMKDYCGAEITNVSFQDLRRLHGWVGLYRCSNCNTSMKIGVTHRGTLTMQLHDAGSAPLQVAPSCTNTVES